MSIVNIFLKNFLRFDVLIFVMAAVNARVFVSVKYHADKLYKHFNPHDRTKNLTEKGKENLKNNTAEKKLLTEDDLLDEREAMNRRYALFSNLTTMFPLFGMLGTVWSLIPMVNTIGTTDTSSFFAALTSTFWGIVAAIVFKFLDAKVSYKIEDNEKHTEYLLFPSEHKKGEQQE